MNSVTQIAVVLESAIAMLLIIVLVFHLWSEYCLDFFRHSLFALRDELFDHAAAGRLDFNSSEYQFLRNLINGTIRFAHKISFLRFVVVFAMLKSREMASVPDSYQEWKTRVESLPKNQRDILVACHERQAELVAKFLALRSVFLMSLLLSYWLLSRPFSVLRPGARELSRRIGEKQLEAQELEEEAETQLPRIAGKKISLAT